MAGANDVVALDGERAGDDTCTLQSGIGGGGHDMFPVLFTDDSMKIRLWPLPPQPVLGLYLTICLPVCLYKSYNML